MPIINPTWVTPDQLWLILTTTANCNVDIKNAGRNFVQEGEEEDAFVDRKRKRKVEMKALGTLNVPGLTEKLGHYGRRKVDIFYVQETSWKESNAYKTGSA